jgi:hypothetical protein
MASADRQFCTGVLLAAPRSPCCHGQVAGDNGRMAKGSRDRESVGDDVEVIESRGARRR